MALDKPMVIVALISCQTIVLGKLRNQFNLVKYYHKYLKRMDETFTCVFDQVEHKFAALLIAVRHFEAVGDDDTVHGQLFAFEGQGGNLYWRMIRVLLADDVDFPGASDGALRTWSIHCLTMAMACSIRACSMPWCWPGYIQGSASCTAFKTANLPWPLT